MNKMTLTPKRLFLIDGIGALVSAFSLGVILTTFEHLFGMPRHILYGLSFVACIFAIHSLSCYLRVTQNWRPFLKAIAIANLLYCCVTLGLVIYFYQQLTILGNVYFLVELIIVISLSSIELKTAMQ